MRLAVCCVAALPATSASAASASFDVVVNGPSDYHVVVDGNVWLSSDSTHVVVSCREKRKKKKERKTKKKEEALRVSVSGATHGAQ